MKRGAPLKTYARLERRTPLRASKVPEAEGRGGRLGRAAPPMNPVRGSAPARRWGSAAVVEAAPSASPSSLAYPKPIRADRLKAKLASRRPQDGGHHGPRTTKKSKRRVGADAQPLVALEGQPQTLGLKFAKPAPRVKAAPARLRGSWIKAKPPRRLFSPSADPARLEFVRHQRCAATYLDGSGDCWLAPGRAVNEANHAEILGMGMKDVDARTFSLCSGHHGKWTAHKGFCEGWTREERKAFEEKEIDRTDLLWANALLLVVLAAGEKLQEPVLSTSKGVISASMLSLGVVGVTARNAATARRRCLTIAGRIIAARALSVHSNAEVFG